MIWKMLLGMLAQWPDLGKTEDNEWKWKFKHFYEIDL